VIAWGEAPGEHPKQILPALKGWNRCGEIFRSFRLELNSVFERRQAYQSYKFLMAAKRLLIDRSEVYPARNGRESARLPSGTKAVEIKISM